MAHMLPPVHSLLQLFPTYASGALPPAEGEVVRAQDGINQEANKFEALRQFLKRNAAVGTDDVSAGGR